MWRTSRWLTGGVEPPAFCLFFWALVMAIAISKGCALPDVAEAQVVEFHLHGQLTHAEAALPHVGPRFDIGREFSLIAFP